MNFVTLTSEILTIGQFLKIIFFGFAWRAWLISKLARNAVVYQV